jgi:hypothetical protein
MLSPVSDGATSGGETMAVSCTGVHLPQDLMRTRVHWSVAKAAASRGSKKADGTALSMRQGKDLHREAAVHVVQSAPSPLAFTPTLALARRRRRRAVRPVPRDCVGGGPPH